MFNKYPEYDDGHIDEVDEIDMYDEAEFTAAKSFMDSNPETERNEFDKLEDIYGIDAWPYDDDIQTGYN